MRKIISLLLFFVSIQLLASGQDKQDIVPKIIPPSPNAAALEKFSNVPIDYSTGVPSISYPFWSWKRNRLEFNLGLSYHAGGHKVDDMASNTGLGWSLTGSIGRISRTIRGMADDRVVSGYMYTDTLPTANTYAYNGDNYYFPSSNTGIQTGFSVNTAVTPLNASYSGTIKAIADNQLDGEQDVFSYSINGASGKFIIDKNKTIIPLEQTKIKFEMTRDPSLGGILMFKITDDKGVVYKFDYLEGQYATTYSNPEPLPPVPNQSGTSGWLLTKIIDPTTQDSIIINYGNTGGGGGQYETSFSESSSATVGINGISAPSVSTSFVGMTVNDVSPSSVVFPDSTTINFSYNFSRADLLQSKALSKITVKNYQNAIAKWFQLRYSYFTSGDGDAYPVWSVSGNDFSKRLRLDSIIEVSNDSTITKPTVFTYNSTLLNARSSRNIDYWGYNVNPARNNLEYAPQIPLTGPELGLALFLGGADRRPDSTFVKAAVLEKIKYPTGGFSSFEYECNKAFSAVNYYENVLNTRSIEWQPDLFGNAVSLSMPGRTDTLVELVLKTSEFIVPRPVPTPPYSCLDDQQDLQTTRFEIVSDDASFSTYVQDVYSSFAGDFKKVVSLPLGKTYTIKFVYDTTISCDFQYRFKATASANYLIVPQDKFAGGLRIKKITTDDGAGNLLVKQYDYNNPDGHSSASFTGLSNIPNFGYYRTALDETVGAGPTVHTGSINRNSNPTNTLNFNGSPLVYTRVTEREADGSVTERYYDPLVWAGNGNDPDEYPYLPLQDFPNLSGMMIKQIIKDNTGLVKTTDSVTYNKVQNYLLNQSANRNIKVGTIGTATDYHAKYYVAEPYFMYTSRVEQTKDSSNVYEKGTTHTDVKTMTYDHFTYYLKTSNTTNSKNEKRTEEYTYIPDAAGTPYTTMVSNNMLNYVVDKTLYVPVVNNELSHSKTNYQLYQSSVLPMAGTVQSSLSGNTLQTDITFNDYDDKGNILQYTAKDGVITSFVWGYKKQYPVAKIIGKSYSDAISQSSLNLDTVDHPSSDAAMRTELDKLRTLSGCFVTTLTYKPLVGATSETDPNGKTNYYVYDAFNRLSLIRDKDNNIVKKFCYNYQGQPMDCGYGTLAGWKAVSSSCEVNGSGLFTGNKIVVEKDLNPSSATYNTTRNITITGDNSCVCTGDDKKIISGVCETGIRVCTSSVINRHTLLFVNTYHYEWSDSSVSSDYTESSSSSCSLSL